MPGNKISLSTSQRWIYKISRKALWRKFPNVRPRQDEPPTAYSPMLSYFDVYIMFLIMANVVIEPDWLETTSFLHNHISTVGHWTRWKLFVNVKWGHNHAKLSTCGYLLASRCGHMSNTCMEGAKRKYYEWRTQKCHQTSRQTNGNS